MVEFHHRPLSAREVRRTRHLSHALIAASLLGMALTLVTAAQLMASITHPERFSALRVVVPLLLAAATGLGMQFSWNMRVTLRPLQRRDLVEIERMLNELGDTAISAKVTEWIDAGVTLRGRDLLAISKAYHRALAERGEP